MGAEPPSLAIRRRIDAFLADPGLWDWLRPAVSLHDFLPLYVGWLAAVGVRPDGSFVTWWDGEEPPRLEPTDPFWARVAAAQGALRYPELAALIPARPPQALDCTQCARTPPPIICSCGGVGWTRPGEERGPSTG